VPLPQDAAPVDNGDGAATVEFKDAEAQILQALVVRTASDPTANPLTGAELGMGLDEPLSTA
jgi:Mn-containing catalase